MKKIKKLLEVVLLVLGITLMYYTAAKGDDQTALNLARCLRAETDTYSGYKNTEWAAMSWVLSKRAAQRGVSLNEMVLDYCAVFDQRGAKHYYPRPRKIRASTFEHPRHGKKRDWRKLKLFTARFLDGLVADPCRQAIHFGNEGDVGNKSLIEVCPWLGKRGNKYYKIGRGEKNGKK